MAVLDDILQNALASLENGKPLNEVLKSLPPEAQELVPAIHLAAEARSISIPPMDVRVVQNQHRQVVEAAHTHYTALRASTPSLFRSRRVILMVGGVLALLLLFCGVIGMLGGAAFLIGPANARSAQLTSVDGFVEVASAQDTSNWAFVEDGQRVREGDRIRTYSESSATLVFFDGTRTLIGPGTEVALTQLGGKWGGVLQAQLSQTSGSTSHSVVPLRGDGKFQVFTPAGQASVHGTIFDVKVIENSQVIFSVTQGEVAVESNGAQVTLTNGQSTSVQSNAQPKKPGYQFSIQGTLESKDTTTWTVSNSSFSVVNGQTVIIGDPQERDAVIVYGRLLDTGEWVADLIEPAKHDKVKMSFTGVVDSIDGTKWIIDGYEVLTDGDTQFSGDPQEGDAVRVHYIIQEDDTRLAKEIEKLEEKETSEAPGTDEESPPVEDTLEPKNDTQRCKESADEHPVAAKLAGQYGVTEEEIMGWFCQGYGFGEIDLAYSLAKESEKPVKDIFSMRRNDGKSWGQIKQELSPTKTPKPKPTARPTNDNRPTKKPHDNHGNGPPEKTPKPPKK